MSIFDPVDVDERPYRKTSYTEEVMKAHIDTNPGYESPEVTSTGNRYALPDADGKVILWPGATTFAKEINDAYGGLLDWQKRQVAWGMGQSPHLVSRAAAAPIDDKDTLNEVVRKAESAARIDAKADTGKAWHMAFERVDRGEPMEALPEMFHPAILARQQAFADYGITILPEYVERVVRCLVYRISGRLDRIGMLEGRFVVIDDKSGVNAIKYPKPVSIQLGTYANAGELWNPQTGQIEPMPDVRKDIALIVATDLEAGTCEIKTIDIAWGWMATYTLVKLREFRKYNGVLVAPLVTSASWQPKQSKPLVAKATEECVIVSAPSEPEKWAPPAQAEADVNGQAHSAQVTSKLLDPRRMPDPEAEALELSEKKKAELVAMCLSVGIPEEQTHRHRLPLAQMYVAARNKLGVTEAEAEVRRAQSAAVVPGSLGDLRGVQQITSTTSAAVAQELTPEQKMLQRINESEILDDLKACWFEWTDDGRLDNWEGTALGAAGNARMAAIMSKPKRKSPFE